MVGKFNETLKCCVIKSTTDAKLVFFANSVRLASPDWREQTLQIIYNV